MYLTAIPDPPDYLGADQRARYAEIRGLIRRNLHFSAHFSWAANMDTIKEVRPHITVGDIPMLIALLEDEQRAIGYGAEGLLATLGEDAVPALRLAAKSEDVNVALNAKSALFTIERCRDSKTSMRPEICPRKKSRKQ